MVALIFIISVLIVIREYFMLAKNRKYMKYTGWWLRGFVVLLLYPNVLFMLIATAVLWIGYDIACAKALKQPWYYIGTTGNIDRWPIWLNYGLKGFTVIFIGVLLFIKLLL